MKISVIVSDNVIVVDGVCRHPVGFIYPEGLRAIQWDGTEGFLEFCQAPQEHFTDETILVDYIAAHAAAPETSGPSAPPVTPAEAALAQIRALEAPYDDDFKKIQRQYLIAALFKEAKAQPAAAGMSDAQIHTYLMAQGKGYAKLYLLEQTIVPLRELL